MQHPDADRSGAFDDGTREAPGRIWIALAVLVGILLFARIMAYPLQHDEQFYVPAGALFSFDGLYDDLGFSHLPNLPLLLSWLYALPGGDHYILIGRVLIALCWAAAAVALALIARDHARGRAVGAFMVAMLVLNPALLDATGMAVTNNFIAVPFALFALYLFLKATVREKPSALLAGTSGLLLAIAMGFKANYIFLLPPFVIAALLVPPSSQFRDRLRLVLLPLAIGGLIGAIPTLYFFAADPTGFVAHSYSFHRGPQLDYWGANVDPLDPKLIGIKDKLMLANRQWLAGVTLILAVAIAFAAALHLAAWRKREHAKAPERPRWPILLVAVLTMLAVLVSFAPTPAFPQYYTLPIPFAIVLFGLLHGTLRAPDQATIRPFLPAAGILAVVIAAPALLSSLPALVQPDRWTGIAVHREAKQIARAVRSSNAASRIATLAPVHALEGGLEIYPHLALGPFIFRATDWIPGDQARHYRYLTSPARVEALLDRTAPAAVLVGLEGPLDVPLSNFALQAGYRSIPVELGGDAATLFVRPAMVRPFARQQVPLPERLPAPAAPPRSVALR